MAQSGPWGNQVADMYKKIRLESWYLWFFPQNCSLSLYPPCSPAWNIFVMSGLVLLATTWKWQISYKNWYWHLKITKPWIHFIIKNIFDRKFGSYTFFLYVNDMKLAVTDCDLRLYTDDTCLLFSNENVNLIKKHLNVDFNSLCEWFIDNKLSLHMGENKTKCILFEKGKKKYPALNITRSESKIKQYFVVEYLDVF